MDKQILSQSSEEEEESQKAQNDGDNCFQGIPICKLPDHLRTHRIVLNVSDTQYEIVSEIGQELGWEVQCQQGYGDWDVWWTDHEIPSDTLFRMNLYQKINHFPGVQALARKNWLSLNLMAMKDKFPASYTFFPETWVVPLQFTKFYHHYQAEKQSDPTYIVKPEALSQGKGIFLTKDIEQIINGKKYVVQKYIDDPFLIDGFKFDLRIYVLLAGTDPLKLYVYEEGLTRLATEKYEVPTPENLNKFFVHLTNYSLNKRNPDFTVNKNDPNSNSGHKRTLSSTYLLLEKLGHDVPKLKQEIYDIVVKTVISGLPAISHQYRYCQPEYEQTNMCFHIMGFDIMLNSKLKPILIQVNHTPSFGIQTMLDKKVKKNLIKDTLKLMNINSKTKRMEFQKAKEIAKKRLQTGKRSMLRGSKLMKKRENLSKKNQNIGAYVKVYPLQDINKMSTYIQMLERADLIHQQTEEARKKLIKEEQERMKAKIKEVKTIQHKQKPKTVENKYRRKIFFGNQSETRSRQAKSITIDTQIKKQTQTGNQIIQRQEGLDTIRFNEVNIKFKDKRHALKRVLPRRSFQFENEQQQDSCVEIRKTSLKGKRYSIIKNNKNNPLDDIKPGTYLRQKVYRIDEEGREYKPKFFAANMKPWQPSQLLLSHISAQLKNYSVHLNHQRNKLIRMLDKDKIIIKKENASMF